MEATCARHPDRPASARCVDCGALRCGACRVRVDGRNWCRGCVPVALRGHLPGRRSPRLAAALSLVPGLGQAYAGHLFRGIVFGGGAMAVAAMEPGLPQPLPLFLWVFNAFDAHALAAARNAEVEGREPTPRERRQRAFFAGLGGLTACFALLRQTAMPELSASLLWPGALLLYAAFVVLDRAGGAEPSAPSARSADVRHA